MPIVVSPIKRKSPYNRQKSPQKVYRKSPQNASRKSPTNRGRGSATRGWKAASPKKGTARHEMSKKCPDCFLLPNEEKFPICTENCKPDCRGITAAKVRAKQYGYEGVYNKAVVMEKKLGCK